VARQKGDGGQAEGQMKAERRRSGEKREAAAVKLKDDGGQAEARLYHVLMKSSFVRVRSV
jgi:hypothetical protein